VLLWQEALTAWTEVAGCAPWRPPKRGAEREPPRLSEAEALARAAAKVELFQRLQLRTLRALQELRRRPAVVVRGARQVNVAGQQVNLSI
jgi:hypothetical protein